MPRFFFDVHDGTEVIDHDGTQLADVGQARIEAAKLFGALLADHAVEFWKGEEWQVVVRDDTGLVLFTLIFMAVNAPASSPVRVF